MLYILFHGYMLGLIITMVLASITAGTVEAQKEYQSSHIIAIITIALMAVCWPIAWWMWLVYLIKDIMDH